MSRNFVRLFAAACVLPALGVMQDAACISIRCKMKIALSPKKTGT